MRDIDDLFAALARSSFRSRFTLNEHDRAYYKRRGRVAILEHAERLINERLAPAYPSNDGRQTPMRNHPVFVAQHATATCCRGCLAKWHGIESGRALDAEEQRYIRRVIARWLDGA